MSEYQKEAEKIAVFFVGESVEDCVKNTEVLARYLEKRDKSRADDAGRLREAAYRWRMAEPGARSDEANELTKAVDAERGNI